MFAHFFLKTLSPFVLLSCLLILLSACSDKQDQEATPSSEPQPPTEAAETGLTDPFAYCESVTTVDAPDERYTGQAMPETLLQTLLDQGIVQADSPDLRKFGFMQWRCMDQNLYVCLAGENLPCEVKADTSTTAHASIHDYCEKLINSDGTLPALVTVPSVYEWTCVEREPKRGKQVLSVDSQGFAETYWTMVPKQ